MPSNAIQQVRALSDAQLDQFIQDGFVRLDNAFPRHLAEQGRAILWRDTGCDPLDSKTWTRPVVRLGYYADAPFREAVNTPLLHAAFDQLAGHGRWHPRADLGTFRCASRTPTIPATPAGTSISVFPALRRIPTSAPISRPGGSTSPRAGARC